MLMELDSVDSVIRERWSRRTENGNENERREKGC